MAILDIEVEKIIPGDDMLLLEIVKSDEETTKSGLILPETMSQGTPIAGLVNKAGAKCRYKSGDTVLFRRYALDELKYVTETGDRTLYFINDADVIAHIDGGNS